MLGIPLCLQKKHRYYLETEEISISKHEYISRIRENGAIGFLLKWIDFILNFKI